MYVSGLQECNARSYYCWYAIGAATACLGIILLGSGLSALTRLSSPPGCFTLVHPHPIASRASRAESHDKKSILGAWHDWRTNFLAVPRVLRDTVLYYMFAGGGLPEGSRAVKGALRAILAVDARGVFPHYAGPLAAVDVEEGSSFLEGC